MDDKKIIELFWQRDECALQETKNKYGKYLYKIVFNILLNHEDCEECLNDAYLRAWNSMPPNRPDLLSAYLGKIVRNLALNTYNKKNRKKRGSGQVELVLHELEECISTGSDIEDKIEDAIIINTINSFLEGLSKEDRQIFVRRYWYLESVMDIAEQNHLSVTNVQTKLYRMRKKLRLCLLKEGVFI